MPLSNDLISQFVKITKEENKTKPETSTYGTVVGEIDGRATIRLDGSDFITPASKTADVRPGDRVTVMIKNHTAVITGNLSSPAARVADLLQAGVDMESFEALLAGTASIGELNAIEARVDDLETKTLTADQIDAVEAVIDILDAGVVTVKDLSVVEARVEVLESDMLTATNADLKYARISDIDATNAEIYQLSSSYAEFKNATADRLSANEAVINSLSSTYATVAMLNAAKARITDLEADVADIDTLIFGSATGDTIQTSFANSVIAQLGDAQIKSAMIDSIVASKITSGDVITNNVRVKSSDGRLMISDQTMQISDANRVRVQIGKDASNDYSINIWDASGNLMFSKGGITDSAIKSAIIRNDMVSETANISASKLDIDSLFDEINGSTKTIKSTRVYLDENKQTLDVAFKSLSSTVTSQGQTITSQGTAISAIQGQITSKIWKQDIDTATNEMSTQYSTLSQTVNSMSSTIESHTSSLGDKADKSAVTTVSNNLSKLEQNLTGFKSTVSETYVNKTDYADGKLGNLIRNGYGEYLDNTNFTNGVFTRGGCPEGCFGYFTNGRTEKIPFDKNKVYEFRYYSRLHEGASGTSYFSVVPYDVDGYEIGSNHVLNYNANLFYLAQDLKNGDTVVKFKDLTKWQDTANAYQRSFLIFNYTDKTGYTYPDGTYSRNYHNNIYTDNSSVNRTNHTITLTSAWTGGTIPAGTCIGQGSHGSTWCYYGQAGNITNTDWKEWSGFIYAGTIGGDINANSRRLLYTKSISLYLYNNVADYCGIYIAEQVIDKTARAGVASAESSIEQLSNRITANVTETTNLGTRISTVEQTASGLDVRLKTTETNVSTAQSTANTAKTNAANAAKTATNYLGLSGTGLVVGDLTKSSLGKNVLIDSDSVDIRNGNTVLASFGASTITLGQNSADSVINLCDGAGTIRALTSGASTSYPAYDSIEIASQEINTSSQRFVTDVTNSYGATSTPAIQNDAEIYMLSNKSSAGSFARMEAMCTTTSSGAEMSAGASAIVYDTYSKTYMSVYAMDSTDTLNRSNRINVYPHKTTYSQPMYRYISGHEYAVFDESMDSGWIEVTSLGSDFTVYASDINSKVRYRKRGKIVEIRGAVKPTSAITGSGDNYTIFTLPSGYRPDSLIHVLCQGSGTFNWLLSITTGGIVRFARYSNGSQYVDTSTSSWLPFQATFLIN